MPAKINDVCKCSQMEITTFNQSLSSTRKAIQYKQAQNNHFFLLQFCIQANIICYEFYLNLNVNLYSTFCMDTKMGKYTVFMHRILNSGYI